MEQLADLHERALETCGAYVGQITEDQWGLPTPDSEWNVRALVNHIVSENFWAEPLLEGSTIEEVGNRFDGDILGNDPVDAYDASAKAAANAAFRTEALAAPVNVSYGPIPGSEFVEHRLLDLVIHGWDVAKATGQDTKIEPELLDAVIDIVDRNEAMIGSSGVFGAPIDVESSADKQTQLLAKLGRRA